MPVANVFAEYLELNKILTETVQAAPQSGQLRIDQAVADKQSASNAFLPTANFFAGSQLAKQFPYRGKSPVEPTLESTLTANAGVSVSQNLYNGGRDSALFNVAEGKKSIATLQQEKNIANLSAQAFKAILELAFSQQQIDQKIQNVEQIQQLDKATLRKIKSGFLGKKDKLQSHIELLRQSSSLAQLRGNLDVKIQNFNLTNELKSYPLAKEKLKVLDKEIKSYCAVVPNNQGNAKNLDLEIQDKQVEIALQNFDIARSKVHHPRLDLVASSSVQIPDNGTKDSGQLPDKSFQNSLTLQLNVPLFDGTVSGQSDSGFAGYQLEKSQRNELKKQIDIGQQSLLQNTIVLEQHWKLLLESQKQALELASQNQRLFDAGQLDFFVLLDSQRNLFQSQSDVITAEYDYLRAKCSARLQQDLGLISEFEK